MKMLFRSPEKQMDGSDLIYNSGCTEQEIAERKGWTELLSLECMVTIIMSKEFE